jgi:replicative DNA helicase
METEEFIIGQMLWYPEFHHALPKIKPQWFTTALHKKVINTMTAIYLSNEAIDILRLSKALKKDEMLLTLRIQQKVSTKASIWPYLRELEYNYLRTNLISQLSELNLTKDLMGLTQDIQKLLDGTKFTTNKEAKSIVHETNMLVDKLVENIQKGQRLTGKPTGWQYLDKYIGGYNGGDLVVIAGRPAMGKTAIALSLTKCFAEIGGKALFLSLEMSNEQLTKRYLSIIGNIPNYKVRNGNLKEQDIDKLCNIANSQTVNFFVDDDPETSINDIKAKVKLHKAKHGLELLVIDYIQLIKGTKQNREQEVAEISRNLKLLAKELNITVIILAQLSRASEARQDKRPLLSDLRESGAIEQDADVVLFPFRPAYYQQDKPAIEEAELIIGKNRNGECATIPTRFEGQLTLYTEDTTPTF